MIGGMTFSPLYPLCTTVGHQRRQLSGQVNHLLPWVQPKCKPSLLSQWYRKPNSGPWETHDRYPGQQSTGITVGWGVCVCPEMKDIETKPGVLIRWGCDGTSHVAYLSLLAWGWLLKGQTPTRQAYCSNSMFIKGICEIIWWTLPISYRHDRYTRANTQLQFGGTAWVLVIYWKEVQWKERENAFYKYIYDSIALYMGLLACFFFNTRK